MNRRFEELDWRQTPLGEISLRRRLDPSLQVEVYEVKLGDEFLMSSLFTVAEVELAHLGLAAAAGDDLDVLVGGLGLGFTAQAALADGRLRSLTVVEVVDAVVEWHRDGLVPFAPGVVSDPRCSVVVGDVFAVVAGPVQDSAVPPRVHALLLDVDHTPRHLLHPRHAAAYTREGLRRFADRLHPGGVFAMWSDGAPLPDFQADLEHVFTAVAAHVVSFPNPLTGGTSASTVYVATTARST